LLAASDINVGFFIVAVFKDTLSAPALSTSLMSSKVLKPPPTVSGINISLAVLEIISCKLFLSYKLATTS